MAKCADDMTSPSKRIREVAAEAGITHVDPERKEICVAGLELCVLNNEDIVFILRDAENIYAAQRRLKAKISERF